MRDLSRNQEVFLTMDCFCSVAVNAPERDPCKDSKQKKLHI